MDTTALMQCANILSESVQQELKEKKEVHNLPLPSQQALQKQKQIADKTLQKQIQDTQKASKTPVIFPEEEEEHVDVKHLWKQLARAQAIQEARLFDLRAEVIGLQQKIQELEKRIK